MPDAQYRAAVSIQSYNNGKAPVIVKRLPTAYQLMRARALAKRSLHLSPPQTITISFALMILVGACLLSLPFASRDGQSIGFLNALFTATSANCVTGLVVVNTLEHWTWFGKIVILVLIQLGGLGFITIMTLFMILVRRKITLKSRMVIQASFNQNSIGGMVRLVRHVLQITLIVEAAGAALLALTFYFSSPGMRAFEAIYKGVFHSISAFCNAGFDIIGPASLMPYYNNVPLNLIIMALILLGGIGFAVWEDIILFIRNPKERSPRIRLIHFSLHSKLAISVTGALILIGALLFLQFEWLNPATLGPMPTFDKILTSVFQSVTLRTCGFNTIDQAGLTEASQALSCVLMIIGGSPASTAGGMKTVTLGVLFFTMFSMLRGNSRIEAFGRTLALDMLQKALTIAVMMMLVVFISTTILTFTERAAFPHSFLDLLFESASAAGTVGVSTGITPHLSNAGKLTLIFCMFLGRLSPVTVVVALALKQHAQSDTLIYPEERVIIG